MNAMIFAAGLGTRLRPLTDHCPKALIEVGGHTMLERILLRLAGAGVDRCVVNIHHHAPMMLSWLKGFNSQAMEVVASDESDLLLDTGGGLVKALPLLKSNEMTILHNADILTTQPLEPMVAFHRQSAADVTLMVMRRKASRKLLFDSNNLMMAGWRNETTGFTRPASLDCRSLEPFGFCGIHMLEPRAIARLADYAHEPGRRVFSITDFYIDCCRDLTIKGFVASADEAWFDIGRLDSLDAARAFVAEQSLPA